jgi:DNA-binding NarL/FixJ family response regulator
MSSQLRIGIVEDQALVLNLLVDLCRHRFGYDVALAARDARSTFAALPDVLPLDALLVDINLPDEDGITLSLSIRKKNPSIKIIILSAECTEYTIFRVRQSGLNGFVDKNADPDFIQAALDSVMNKGQAFFSPVVSTVAKHIAQDSQAFTKVLTDREHELLSHFGMGRSDADIAAVKGIAAETVRKHRENIMRKLNLRSLPELVHYCIEKGFLQTRPDGDVRPTIWTPFTSSS